MLKADSARQQLVRGSLLASSRVFVVGECAAGVRMLVTAGRVFRRRKIKKLLSKNFFRDGDDSLLFDFDFVPLKMNSR